MQGITWHQLIWSLLQYAFKSSSERNSAIKHASLYTETVQCKMLRRALKAELCAGTQERCLVAAEENCDKQLCLEQDREWLCLACLWFKELFQIGNIYCVIWEYICIYTHTYIYLSVSLICGVCVYMCVEAFSGSLQPLRLKWLWRTEKGHE